MRVVQETGATLSTRAMHEDAEQSLAGAAEKQLRACGVVVE
jgi:hypothetical protein